MKSLRTLSVGIATAVIFGLLTGTAWAIPSAEFTYTETALEGNLWQYEYTMSNTSDPEEDIGYDLFDVFFTFNPEAFFNISRYPDGWAGDGYMGSAYVCSPATEVSPEGIPYGEADIKPGESLDGLIFQFDRQIEEFFFTAMLTNPKDPFNPVVYSGTAINVSPIPEPCTLLLFMVGLIGIVGLKKRA